MELYIIRHGQSTNNVLPSEKGRVCDPPLTDLGKQQAERLAAYFSDGHNREPGIDPQTGHQVQDQSDSFGLTHLYCSAMYRALQTSQPLARTIGLKPEVWIDIHEHGGMYLEQPDGIVGLPGMTRTEILKEFADYVLPETITDSGWYDHKVGLESLHLAQGRAIKVAGELRRRATTSERIAIVSHGTFIDALLKALFNQLPTRNLYYSHYNTSVTRIDFFGEKERLLVRYVNRVTHLPNDMIS